MYIDLLLMGAFSYPKFLKAKFTNEKALLVASKPSWLKD